MGRRWAIGRAPHGLWSPGGTGLTGHGPRPLGRRRMSPAPGPHSSSLRWAPPELEASAPPPRPGPGPPRSSPLWSQGLSTTRAATTPLPSPPSAASAGGGRRGSGPPRVVVNLRPTGASLPVPVCVRPRTGRRAARRQALCWRREPRVQPRGLQRRSSPISFGARWISSCVGVECGRLWERWPASNATS